MSYDPHHDEERRSLAEQLVGKRRETVTWPEAVCFVAFIVLILGLVAILHGV